jgi:hypothetical protein
MTRGSEDTLENFHMRIGPEVHRTYSFGDAVTYAIGKLEGAGTIMGLGLRAAGVDLWIVDLGRIVVDEDGHERSAMLIPEGLLKRFVP